VAARPGAAMGRLTRRNAPKRVAPSTIADSSSSMGMSSKKPVIIQIASGSVNVRYEMINAARVSSRSSPMNST